MDECKKKKGAFIDHPWGEDVTVIKMKAEKSPARIFAQIFVLKDEPSVTLNCDRMTGEFYRGAYPGTVARGWHCPPVQQPYFNTVKLSGDVPDDELLRMIEHSYQTVLLKLPKYAQRELADL